MRRILLACAVSLVATTALAAPKMPTVEVPKNVVVLGQSSTGDWVMMSAVDADTGDLIVIAVKGNTIECYRTGAKVDLAKQAEAGHR